MKKIFTAFYLIISFFINITTVSAQTAHVQFIHNSPDSTLPAIDIYINGSVSFTNIGFRHATSFVALPSSGMLSIGIAPANKTISDTIKNINITLQKDSFYYIITSGLIDTAKFAHNPGGLPINFSINVFSHATNSNPFNHYDCGLQYFNGSTDAPLYNLYDRQQRHNLFSEISYGQFAPAYKDEITYQPAVIDLMDTANTQIQATYLADLVNRNLEGHTAIIFSSGFNTPSNNKGGPAFGLFAALYNGSIIQLNDTSIASLQLINNSADPSALGYDVYINGTLFSSYLYFRFATTYINVPAGTNVEISLAPVGSFSVADATDSFSISFNNAESYVGILSGVKGSGFKANPDSKNISLDIFKKSNAQPLANDTSKVAFYLFNGSTDEPSINVKLSGSGNQLGTNLSYGTAGTYTELSPKAYNFDILSSANNSIVFGTYNVDLSFYRSQGISIFTSGFVDSVNNNNGPSLGLFGALNNGNVIQFPLISYSAQAQFINNIADPSLTSVAVFVNGNPIINNLPFRKATYFSGIAAGSTINVGVAPLGSTSVSDTVASFKVTLVPNSTNILMLKGVVHPASFVANPDGENIALSLSLIDSVHTTAAQNMVDVKMIHASTDEPTNDFIIDNSLPPLFDNVKYGNITSYQTVSASTHPFNMADAGNDNSITRKYIALFAPYSGSSLTIFSSGFLNPPANQNGAAFGLYAADTSGNVFPLTDITGMDNINPVEGISAYPNPASENVTVSNGGNEPLLALLTDLNGKQIKNLGTIPAYGSVNFALTELASGVYIIKTVSLQGIEYLQLAIQK